MAFEEHVAKQNRSVLDASVPAQLSREVAIQSPLRFLYDLSGRSLRLAPRERMDGNQFVEMTAVEVHDQFGGAIIEEVLEYGFAEV